MQGGKEAGRQGGRKAGRQEGRKAGRQEGRKAGRQEGRKAGRQEGRKAGRQEGRKAGAIVSASGNQSAAPHINRKTILVSPVIKRATTSLLLAALTFRLEANFCPGPISREKIDHVPASFSSLKMFVL